MNGFNLSPRALLLQRLIRAIARIDSQRALEQLVDQAEETAKREQGRQSRLHQREVGAE